MRALLPNDKYYEMFGGEPPQMAIPKGPGKARKQTEEKGYGDLPDGSQLAFGQAMAIFKLAHDCGLFECLSRTFGEKRTIELLSLASFYLSGPRGLTSLEYYTKTQMCFTNTIITAQAASRIFADISASDRHDFFKLWIPKATGQDYVCYDVTSISTYSDALAEISFGYNRDHEKLPQVNLGLFTTSSQGIPVFYAQYNGNINDFTGFPYVLAQARDLGLKGKFLLVMDGGFASGSPIDFAQYKGYDVIVGAPTDHCPGVKGKILEWRKAPSITDVCFRKFDQLIDSAEQPFTLNGVQGRLIMYLQGETHNLEKSALVKKINRQQESLQEMHSKKAEVPRWAKEFFVINPLSDHEWTAMPNEQAIADALSLCGCFALFTTGDKLSAERCLQLYRTKDFCEKAFAELKNEVIGERMLVNSERTWQGKMFVAFLALILRHLLRIRLGDWIKAKRLSLETAIIMLRDIECRKTGSRWVLRKAYTKEQREMVALLKLQTDCLLV